MKIFIKRFLLSLILISCGLNITCQSALSSTQNPIKSKWFKAIELGQLKQFQDLYDDHSDELSFKTSKNDEGLLPLHVMSQYGRNDFIAYALTKILPEDVLQILEWQAGEDLALPIHLAAANNHADTVDLLLKNGALYATTNKYGRTALDMAAHQGNEEIIFRLVEEHLAISPSTKSLIENLIGEWSEVEQRVEIYELTTKENQHLKSSAPATVLSNLKYQHIPVSGLNLRCFLRSAWLYVFYLYKQDPTYVKDVLISIMYNSQHSAHPLITKMWSFLLAWLESKDFSSKTIPQLMQNRCANSLGVNCLPYPIELILPTISQYIISQHPEFGSNGNGEFEELFKDIENSRTGDDRHIWSIVGPFMKDPEVNIIYHHEFNDMNKRNHYQLSIEHLVPIQTLYLDENQELAKSTSPKWIGRKTKKLFPFVIANSGGHFDVYLLNE